MLPGWARLCRFVRRSRFPGLGLVVLGRHRNAALALMRTFSTEIWYGERVAVLGLNGSGKSHYLRLLAGDILHRALSQQRAAGGGWHPVLSELANLYRRGVQAANDQHLEEAIQAVLTERAPAVLDLPAEPALTRMLRHAHELGWDIQHAVPDTESLHGIEGANDPAAVLYRRVEHRWPVISASTTPQGPRPDTRRRP